MYSSYEALILERNARYNQAQAYLDAQRHNQALAAQARRIQMYGW